MIETIVGIVSAASLGLAGWVIQLGNRVSILEVQKADLKELIETKFDGQDIKFNEVSRRLARIERGMNGHLREED